MALLLACLLVARVVEVQGFGAAKYAAYGNSELYQSVTLPALRGTIYDRNGNVLAVSVPRVDVVSDDYLVSSPGTDLGTLARMLRLPAATLRPLLTEKSGYVTLERQVGQSTESAVAALHLPNISFVPDPERTDPDGALFSPLLGVVGFSGTGLSGIEYQKQDALKGVAGSELLAMGAAGEALPQPARDITPAHQGDGLVLTLDAPLQFEATQALTTRLEQTHAATGTVVVLDTRTGGVLAMVNLRRSKDGRVSPAAQNLAVTSEYQPGSVMKLATISAALQDGIISPSSTLTVPFEINVGGSPFEDADYHPTETLSVGQNPRPVVERRHHRDRRPSRAGAPLRPAAKARLRTGDGAAMAGRDGG